MRFLSLPSLPRGISKMCGVSDQSISRGQRSYSKMAGDSSFESPMRMQSFWSAVFSISQNALRHIDPFGFHGNNRFWEKGIPLRHLVKFWLFFEKVPRPRMECAGNLALSTTYIRGNTVLPAKFVQKHAMKI